MATSTSSDEVNLVTTVPVPVSTKPSDRAIPLALLQQLQQHHQLMRQQEVKRQQEKQAQLDKEKRERELQLNMKLQQGITFQQEDKRQQYLKQQLELKEKQFLMRKNELQRQSALKKQQEIQQQQQQQQKELKQQQEMQQQQEQKELKEQHEIQQQQQQQDKHQETQEQEIQNEAVDCGADNSSEDFEAKEEVMQVEPRDGEQEREMYLAHQEKKRKWVLQKQRQRAMTKAQKQPKQQPWNQHVKVKVSVPTNYEQPRRLFTCQYCPFATTFGNRYRTHSNNHAMGFEFRKLQRARNIAAANAHRVVVVDEQEEKSQCPFCSFRAHGPTGVCRHVRVHFDFQHYLEIRGFEVKYERCWLDTDTIKVKSNGKSSSAQSAKS